MIARRISAALAAALVVSTLVLAGCVGASPETGTSPAGSGSVGATVSVLPSATVSATSTAGASDTQSTGSAGTETKDVTGDDLAAIRKQLEAMQKELDSLKMPSDSDFADAEGAVY